MAQAIEFTTAAGLEGARLGIREIVAFIDLYGASEAGSVAAGTNVTGVIPYVATLSQPTPVDSGANFGTLDSTADPTTIGVLALTGFAKRIVDIYVPNQGITSASMTAGAITKCGASNTGITASGNIAFVVSCVGLDLDSAIVTHSFPIVIKYLPDRNLT